MTHPVHSHHSHLRAGNCLQLNNGRIGWIDCGQTRRIDDDLRRAFAEVVVTLTESRHNHRDRPSYNSTAVANAMRGAGFAAKDNSDDETLLQFGRLFFDSDEESERQGYRIPQNYFKRLMAKNPLVDIPDSASTCRSCIRFDFSPL